MNKNKIHTPIRWLIRRDMQEVLDIEAANFKSPWLEDDFVRCLRQRNFIGMVAEYNEKVIGFMIYELSKTRLHTLNFAVAPEYHRKGFGSHMVGKLKAKLSMQRRNRIILEVREKNLPAQLFFRENGFRAISTLKNFYEDTPEDAYLMQYSHKPEAEKHQPVNRISRLSN